MSVYLFMKRYTAEEIYQPRHPSFYRPRLSNCSDHSGQFLHPEAWSRGRSPSDISSEASLQMSASYPALLKCPDYDQVSSSPCWGHIMMTKRLLMPSEDGFLSRKKVLDIYLSLMFFREKCAASTVAWGLIWKRVLLSYLWLFLGSETLWEFVVVAESAFLLAGDKVCRF